MPLPRYAAFAAAFLAVSAGLASAESYPVRPIRFIVPYAPGGGADLMARIVHRHEIVGFTVGAIDVSVTMRFASHHLALGRQCAAFLFHESPFPCFRCIERGFAGTPAKPRASRFLQSTFAPISAISFAYLS
jgi:hypothetical protein